MELIFQHGYVIKKAIQLQKKAVIKFLREEVAVTKKGINDKEKEKLKEVKDKEIKELKIPEIINDPNMVKTTKKHKHKLAFSTVFQIQDISSCTGAIWVMKFSVDGKYLATGGHDTIVRIWKVKDQRETFFEPTPIRTYSGHTGDILDLSWSKNNFILSGSMDKTVRLWYISRDECLHIFQHDDFVTSVAFHPTSDKMFLSGALDKKFRLWSVTDKSILSMADVGSFITAVAFAEDGKTSIAASYNGKCTFFDTDGLKWKTQIHVHSSRGKNRKGKKITGMEVMPGGAKMLITSNDSRVRLYHLSDYSLICKYKGLINNNYQIKATFSENGNYIICGSEDHNVYIWDTNPLHWVPYIANINPLRHKRSDRSQSYESFVAHSETVTVALFAPFSSISAYYSTTDQITEGQIMVTADALGQIRIFANKREVTAT